jgi:hypothetical protein
VEEFCASAEAEVVGSTGQARNTSGKVAEDGILTATFTNIPGTVQICLMSLLTTESFCSAVGQHCQGEGGQDDKQNRITPCGGIKIG